MADVHSKEVRSYNMSRVKNKDTKPELLVRKFLFTNGLRYRLHDKKLPGKPDIVLPKFKTVVFIHGCFWHGHEKCKYAALPQTRIEFWGDKIERNKQRDAQNLLLIKDKGWNVLTIFECDLKKEKQQTTLSTILYKIRNNDQHIKTDNEQ
ncbi:MAG: DNA mismatch endonuclease Vsr [Crocinitomicaceae bacterium]|nr:DNA mismatch endonuclease Vsr [Crocinitomicaceae bacterium]NGF74708.1 DNA mismatch endonuclease Vsr [Fluviicola sp. SGL-29]